MKQSKPSKMFPYSRHIHLYYRASNCLPMIAEFRERLGVHREQLLYYVSAACAVKSRRQFSFPLSLSVVFHIGG